MPATSEVLKISMRHQGEDIEIIWNREQHKKVEFDFMSGDATFERDGPDLVVKVKDEDGEEFSVRLLNFFADHSKDDFPTFVFADNQPVPAQDILAASKIDTSISRANLNRAAFFNGLENYDDNSGHLLDGLSRLGKVEGDPFGWGDSSSLFRDTGGLKQGYSQLNDLYDNNPPVIGDYVATSTDEAMYSGLRIEGVIEGYDPDKDPNLSYDFGNIIAIRNGMIVSLSDYGTIKISSDGSWSFAAETDAQKENMLSLAVGEELVITVATEVTDSYKASDHGKLTITVVGTNQAPKFTTEYTDYETTEGDLMANPNLVSGVVKATDVDSGDILTYSISGGTNNTLAGKYGTFSLNAATGQWSYARTQDITWMEKDQRYTDSFVIIVSDGKGGTAEHAVHVYITGDGLTPPSYQTEVLEHTLMASQTLTGVFDTQFQGSPVTYTIAGPDVGNYGKLVLTPHGSWTYTLTQDIGWMKGGSQYSEKFTVTATLPDGTPLTETLTILIDGQNDPPQFYGGRISEDTSEDELMEYGYYSSYVTAADEETPLAQLTYSIVEGTAQGRFGYFTITPNGTWKYTRTEDINWMSAGQQYIEKCTVEVSDGNGGTARDTIELTIHGDNDAPTITNSEASASDVDMYGGLVLSGAVQGSDPDLLDTLTYTHGAITATVDGASKNYSDYGAFTLNADGTWSFKAVTQQQKDNLLSLAKDQELIITVPATVEDNHNDTGTGDVVIKIIGTNQAPEFPTAVTDINSTEDTLMSNAFLTGTITASDVDGDTLSYSISGGSNNSLAGLYGTLSIDPATGGWLYERTQDINWMHVNDVYTETFTVVVSDGKGGTAEHTLHINITGNNDAPSINDSTVTATISQVVGVTGFTGSILDADPDQGDVLLVTQVGTATAKLGGTTVNIDDYGQFTIDSSGNWTLKAVTSTQQANMQAITRTNQLEIKVNILVDDQNGLPNSTDSGILTITIDGQNHAPSFQSSSLAASTTEDTLLASTTLSGTLSGTDPDGDTLTYSFSASQTSSNNSGTYGTIVLNSNGTWTYTLNSDINWMVAGQNYQEKFTVYVNDGYGGVTQGELVITIAGSNDLPVIQDSSFTATDEYMAGGQVLTGNLSTLTTDVDNDTGHGGTAADTISSYGTGTITGTLNGNAITISNYGVFTLDTSTGVWTFKAQTQAQKDNLLALNNNDKLVITVPVTATDNHSGTGSGTVTITINGQNAAAHFVNSQYEDDAVNPLNAFSGNLSVTGGQGYSFVNPSASTYIQNLTIDASGNYSYSLTSAGRSMAAALNVLSSSVVIPFVVNVDVGNGVTLQRTLDITIVPTNADSDYLRITQAMVNADAGLGTRNPYDATQLANTDSNIYYLDRSDGQLQGNDTVVLAAGLTGVTLYTYGGDDSISAEGNLSGCKIDAGIGADTIAISGTIVNTTVNADVGTNTVSCGAMNATAANNYIYSAAGTVTIGSTLLQGTSSVSLYAAGGNSNTIAASSASGIPAVAGTVTINAASANNTMGLQADSGTNTVSGDTITLNSNSTGVTAYGMYTTANSATSAGGINTLSGTNVTMNLTGPYVNAMFGQQSGSSISQNTINAGGTVAITGTATNDAYGMNANGSSNSIAAGGAFTMTMNGSTSSSNVAMGMVASSTSSGSVTSGTNFVTAASAQINATADIAYGIYSVSSGSSGTSFNNVAVSGNFSVTAAGTTTARAMSSASGTYNTVVAGGNASVTSTIGNGSAAYGIYSSGADILKATSGTVSLTSTATTGGPVYNTYSAAGSTLAVTSGTTMTMNTTTIGNVSTNVVATGAGSAPTFTSGGNMAMTANVTSGVGAGRNVNLDSGANVTLSSGGQLSMTAAPTSGTGSNIYSTSSATLTATAASVNMAASSASGASYNVNAASGFTGTITSSGAATLTSTATTSNTAYNISLAGSSQFSLSGSTVDVTASTPNGPAYNINNTASTTTLTSTSGAMNLTAQSVSNGSAYNVNALSNSTVTLNSAAAFKLKATTGTTGSANNVLATGSTVVNNTSGTATFEAISGGTGYAYNLNLAYDATLSKNAAYTLNAGTNAATFTATSPGSTANIYTASTSTVNTTSGNLSLSSTSTTGGASNINGTGLTAVMNATGTATFTSSAVTSGASGNLTLAGSSDVKVTASGAVSLSATTPSGISTNISATSSSTTLKSTGAGITVQANSTNNTSYNINATTGTVNLQSQGGELKLTATVATSGNAYNASLATSSALTLDAGTTNALTLKATTPSGTTFNIYAPSAATMTSSSAALSMTSTATSGGAYNVFATSSFAGTSTSSSTVDLQAKVTGPGSGPATNISSSGGSTYSVSSSSTTNLTASTSNGTSTNISGGGVTVTSGTALTLSSQTTTGTAYNINGSSGTNTLKATTGNIQLTATNSAGGAYNVYNGTSANTVINAMQGNIQMDNTCTSTRGNIYAGTGSSATVSASGNIVLNLNPNAAGGSTSVNIASGTTSSITAGGSLTINTSTTSGGATSLSASANSILNVSAASMTFNNTGTNDLNAVISSATGSTVNLTTTSGSITAVGNRSVGFEVGGTLTANVTGGTIDVSSSTQNYQANALRNYGTMTFVANGMNLTATQTGNTAGVITGRAIYNFKNAVFKAELLGSGTSTFQATSTNTTSGAQSVNAIWTQSDSTAQATCTITGSSGSISNGTLNLSATAAGAAATILADGGLNTIKFNTINISGTSSGGSNATAIAANKYGSFNGINDITCHNATVTSSGVSAYFMTAAAAGVKNTLTADTSLTITSTATPASGASTNVYGMYSINSAVNTVNYTGSSSMTMTSTINGAGTSCALWSQLASSNVMNVTSAVINSSVTSGTAYGLYSVDSSSANTITNATSLTINATTADNTTASSTYGVCALTNGTNTINMGTGSGTSTLVINSVASGNTMNSSNYALQALGGGKNIINGSSTAANKITLTGAVNAGLTSQNSIVTGSGADSIKITGNIGGAGTNSLSTGAGDDIIILDGAVTNLTIDAGAGNDTLYLVAADAATFDANYKTWLTNLINAGTHNIENIVIVGTTIPTWLTGIAGTINVSTNSITPFSLAVRFNNLIAPRSLSAVETLLAVEENTVAEETQNIVPVPVESNQQDSETSVPEASPSPETVVQPLSAPSEASDNASVPVVQDLLEQDAIIAGALDETIGVLSEDELLFAGQVADEIMEHGSEEVSAEAFSAQYDVVTEPVQSGTGEDISAMPEVQDILPDSREIFFVDEGQTADMSDGFLVDDATLLEQLRSLGEQEEGMFARNFAAIPEETINSFEVLHNGADEQASLDEMNSLQLLFG